MHDEEKTAIIPQYRVDGIVVDEIAGVVKYKFVPVYFYSLKYMGTMAVNDIGALIDHFMRQFYKGRMRLLLHIGPPMDAYQDNIRQ
ncbi:MAG TPA: hypothetical protein VHE34_17810 [Puia sp.]|nr:hypothetical protein [Puia sp.]HVU97093.1 hypothetical protein [Puia sp.]